MKVNLICGKILSKQVRIVKMICKGTNEEGVSSPKDEWDLDENPWEREEEIGLRK